MKGKKEENDTSTCKLRINERKEEYHALMDALPQFVWLMQSDGSLVYENQRWRDYRQLLFQHTGKQERFANQQCDDSPRVQDRQRTQPANRFPL
ncbi:hypothetical protein [Ktedonobacter racemifer]|uniref:hypothetical protein n=1 Tax=Ktedonobacter racemifer TaxID=363277 RepID=UPI000303B827|nr:hypothetical protein [Ktedonobacter racemifer]